MANTQFTIALVGFPQTEQSTFETFIRLVSPRRPRPLVIVPSLHDAQLVLCSFDSKKPLPLIDPSRQILVTIGAEHSQASWRHLGRPVNLNAVLAVIDAAATEIGGSAVATQPAMNGASSAAAMQSPALSSPHLSSTAVAARIYASAPALTTAPIPRVASSPAAPSTPVVRPATPAPQVSPVKATPLPPLQPLPSMGATQRPLSPTAAPPLAARQLAAASQTRPIPAPVPKPMAVQESATPVSMTNILVVDDSDVALKFIHSRLSAFGFNVDLSMSGEEALVRVADGSYDFVFLDVMMAGLDGYQTCKAIKGRKYAGGKTPVVVMLTSRGGAIDKVRGTFAGCDAYLTKPLDEAKMLKVLLRHNASLSDAVSTIGIERGPELPNAATMAGSKRDPLSRAYENLEPGFISK